jgi:hypothetical protein
MGMDEEAADRESDIDDDMEENGASQFAATGPRVD